MYIYTHTYIYRHTHHIHTYTHTHTHTHTHTYIHTYIRLPYWLSSKESACNAGPARHSGSILGLGRSPGEGNGNPLQYSCLENPMDRGAWRATVHGVTKSWTQLKRLSTHSTHTHTYRYVYVYDIYIGDYTLEHYCII